MQGDFLGAFALCRDILAVEPQSLPALLLFGRLCIIAGETRAGIDVLHAAVGLSDPPAGHAVQLLTLLPIAQGEAPTPAASAYARAVAIDPDIERHADQHVFAQPVPLARHVETSLREAISQRSGFTQAHAALGNALMREGRIAEGLAEYERAASLDCVDAEVLFGFAERLRLFERAAEARNVLARALSLSHTVLQPAAYEEQLSVLVLYSDDFWEKFVAIDLLADREHLTIQKAHVSTFSAAPQGPRVCFNAVTDPEDGAALQAVARASVASGLPCLNDPELIPRTSRTYLPQRGRLNSALCVPATIRAAREDIHERPALAYPFLIRPRDSHRGERLARISARAELEAYLAANDDDTFFLTEYVECRGEDGYYRKYRFIIVEGVPYPHHLAVSDAWMVHYFRSLMREHAWMRLEEAAFLHDPQNVFNEEKMDALRSLAQEIRLDYFGVDCTIHDDKVLVFEANANMLAHNFFEEAAFAYKTAPFRILQRAFNEMLRKAALR